jgi:hypothetical protein
MADFTALTVDTGEGAIHFNRFRIAFEPPAGTSAATLASDLIDNFPTYLKSEFATVEFGDRDFEGKRTLRFHGYAKLLGLDLAAAHDDWVVRQWVDRNVGFTAQTLKREFFSAGDDVGVTAETGLLVFVPVIGPILGVGGALGIGATAGVHYNRMHFLAGRRSWRISDGTVFGLSGSVIVLETVAVERFSATPFRTVNAIIGLEAKVPDVWIAFLNNFVNKKGLKVVTQTLKARWINKARADYVQLTFDDTGDLAADPEFQDAYKLYPTILP